MSYFEQLRFVQVQEGKSTGVYYYKTEYVECCTMHFETIWGPCTFGKKSNLADK